MSQIRIVTDTTSTLTFAEAKEYGIDLIPLSVVLHDEEYKDGVDMNAEALYNKLGQGEVPTTSQPNIGLLEEAMMKWREAKDDAIIIITISSGLSGTYQGFSLVKEQLGMDQVYLVDSKTVAAPIRDAALKAKAMADEGADVDAILDMLDNCFNNTISFLYPHDLVQLKRGGRISPVAANMASLLKIKPLLFLLLDGSVVDKFGMARTESKIFDMVLDHFLEQGVTAQTHKLYIPHALAADTVDRFLKAAAAKLGNIEYEILALPAVLTCHGGLGCIAIQSTIR